jgi:glutamyl-tRNA synthetase
MREQQKAANLAPRYDNRHRHLTPEQEAAFIAAGRKPVIRFQIEDDREIVWQDQVRDRVVWKGSDLGGDMVIARTADQEGATFGQPLYNLAVVVDDIDMEITHVIRGEDHIANTAKQILLYEALEAKVPEFAHTPLILNKEGKKLSKRDGVTSIDDFKKMGFVPQAMANYMTLLGWTPPESTQEIFSLTQAAESFSLERVNKAGAKFDWDKLDWINSQYLHHLPAPELVKLLLPYWQEAGYNFTLEQDGAWLEELTALIAPSLTRLQNAVAESQLLLTETVEIKEDAQHQLEQTGAKEVLRQILAFLQTGETLTAEVAKEQLNQITKTLGVKKGVVMKSLRAGLMGTLQGPDLTQSWLLLNQKGWDQIRLSQVLANG